MPEIELYDAVNPNGSERRTLFGSEQRDVPLTVSRIDFTCFILVIQEAVLMSQMRRVPIARDNTNKNACICLVYLYLAAGGVLVMCHSSACSGYVL